MLIFRKQPKSDKPQGKDLPTEPQPATSEQQSQQSDSSAKRDPLLLVFIVSETPTAGLNRAAFLKSLHYIRQLTPQTKLEISVAGPIFSATLPPLGEAISEFSKEFSSEEDHPIFQVVNYGARSDAAIHAFHEKLLLANRSSSFSSLDLTFNDAQNELVTFLHDLGYEDTEIAVLAEDGSAYGNAVPMSRG